MDTFLRTTKGLEITERLTIFMKSLILTISLLVFYSMAFTNDLKTGLANLQTLAIDKLLHVEINLDHNKQNYRLQYTGIITDAEKGYFYFPFAYQMENITNIKCWLNGIEMPCKVIDVDQKSRTALAKVRNIKNASAFPVKLTPISSLGTPLFIYSTMSEENFFRGFVDNGHFINYRFDQTDSVLTGGLTPYVNVLPGSPVFDEKFEIVGLVSDGNKRDIHAIYDIKKNIDKMIRKHERKKSNTDDSKKDEKPYLGIMVQSINEHYARYAGLPVSAIIITAVYKNSPAEKAGLTSGDIITGINGEKFLGVGAIVEKHFWKLLDPEVGQEIIITLLRNNKDLNVNLKFEKQSEPKEFKNESLGIHVSEISQTEYFSQDLQIPEGVYIKSIVPGSPAATSLEFGSMLMSANDIILEIENKKINNVHDFSEATQHIVKEKLKSVLIKIQRGSSTKFVALKLNLKSN